MHEKSWHHAESKKIKAEEKRKFMWNVIKLGRMPLTHLFSKTLVHKFWVIRVIWNSHNNSKQ